MALIAKFTRSTIEAALAALEGAGYEASIHAKDHGMGDQYIVVQDPFHSGAVLMRFDPNILRSSDCVFRFISERS
jgi:hypothetical protein